MRSAIVAAACFGTICFGVMTIVNSGEAGANSDYVFLTKAVAVNETLYWPRTKPADAVEPIEAVRLAALSIDAIPAYGQSSNEPTILMIIGLVMSGLALWGSRRCPAS